MEDIKGYVVPVLEFVREWIMLAAEFISPIFDLEPTNVYLFLIIIVSILVGKKVLEFFYTTLDGRQLYWVLLSGFLFWLLYYFN